ncbi:hypothetical protein [Streptomyces sp. NBC_00576]|uniref:hypothetical protein n=1 Tax=Streptomyces sp. NBC_00576 TaxID=2903665 RepID=UPI002E7FCC76|nr:hypothetical protein [Streptomyces sp. NBC_00576]WUB76987.1 hypothetical protein OG734_47030 [Streptomyces sp. NBC_00576]
MHEEDAGDERERTGALLDQCAVCGICGQPCRHEDATPDEPASYRCPSDCQPAITAADLEKRVGQAVIGRLYTPAGLARMAAAEQLLHQLGYELPQPVALSLPHAVRQWTRDFDQDTRKAVVRDWLLAVVLNPPRSRHEDAELFFAWRRPRDGI